MKRQKFDLGRAMLAVMTVIAPLILVAGNYGRGLEKDLDRSTREHHFLQLRFERHLLMRSLRGTLSQEQIRNLCEAEKKEGSS